MPYGPDKILLNSGNFAADAGQMMSAFRIARKLGKEIIKAGRTMFGKDGVIDNDWLKADAKLHLPEQEAICADLDKAMADCVTRQRALNDKRRRWFDKILDGKLTP